MTFTSLASSSHGNCYVVSDGQTVILPQNQEGTGL